MNSDELNPADASGFDAETEDPIDVLREQELNTSSNFLARVRNKIHRRTAASQVASYSWNVPRVVVLELASILNYMFTAFIGKNRS